LFDGKVKLSHLSFEEIPKKRIFDVVNGDDANGSSICGDEVVKVNIEVVWEDVKLCRIERIDS